MKYQFKREWVKELKKSKPNIMSCFVRIYWFKMIILTFALIVEVINRLLYIFDNIFL